MRRRRTCHDRFRYAAIRELRAWRDRILREDNGGVKKRMINNRDEIRYACWDYGWTTYVTLELMDGYEIKFSTNGRKPELVWPYEDVVAKELYRVLWHRMGAMA